MDSNMRAEMIIWLRGAIECETDKPDDEINYELVDELSGLLAELMDGCEYLTDEEAEQRLARIMESKPKKVKRKPRIKLKRTAIAACAALVTVSAAVTITSFDGSEKSIMRAMFNQDDGTFNDSGVTYIKMNDLTTYSSVEELVEREELDIRYPTVLPDGVKIEKVLYNTNSIIIVFSDESLQMGIYDIDHQNLDKMIENSDKLNINGTESYIVRKNNIVSSYTIIDDNVYLITSNTEEVIELILNGLLDGTK